MLEMKLQYILNFWSKFHYFFQTEAKSKKQKAKENCYSTHSKATILWLNLFLPRFEDFLKEAFWTRYQPFPVKIVSSCDATIKQAMDK